MGLELINALNDISYEAINSTLINNSMKTNFNDYKSIWVFHSQALPLTINISQEWLQAGKGLFVLSNYPDLFNYDFQILLGIDRVYPFHYPLNDSDGKLLLEPQSSNNAINLTTNLTLNPVEYYGNSALVQMNDQVVPLVTISLPIINNSEDEVNLQQPTNGIFANPSLNKRIIFGSISSYKSNNSTKFLPNVLKNFKINQFKWEQSNIQSVKQELLPSEIMNLFTLFTDYSISGEGSAVSGESGIGINFENIDFSQVRFLLGILTLIVAFFVFLTGKGRSILFGIFAGLIAVIAHIAYTPVRRRLTRTDLLENETRAKILTFIESRDARGAHLREIQRSVGCGVSTLLWHLQTLEDFHLIESMKAGRYTLFFSVDVSIENGISDFSAVLRTEMARNIFSFLMEKDKPQTLASISKHVSCHPETARYHLKKLEDFKVVIKSKDGKRTLYIVPPNRRKQYNYNVN
jgi:predicted transcriptional regulator